MKTAPQTSAYTPRRPRGFPTSFNQAPPAIREELEKLIDATFEGLVPGARPMPLAKFTRQRRVLVTDYTRSTPYYGETHVDNSERTDNRTFTRNEGQLQKLLRYLCLPDAAAYLGKTNYLQHEIETALAHFSDLDLYYEYTLRIQRMSENDILQSLLCRDYNVLAEGEDSVPARILIKSYGMHAEYRDVAALCNPRASASSRSDAYVRVVRNLSTFDKADQEISRKRLRDPTYRAFLSAALRHMVETPRKADAGIESFWTIAQYLPDEAAADFISHPHNYWFPNDPALIVTLWNGFPPYHVHARKAPMLAALSNMQASPFTEAQDASLRITPGVAERFVESADAEQMISDKSSEIKSILWDWPRALAQDENQPPERRALAQETAGQVRSTVECALLKAIDWTERSIAEDEASQRALQTKLTGNRELRERLTRALNSLPQPS